MPKYSSKNGGRRKNQKKHTKRKLRRGKSRKVMRGGINKIYREYGGSLPRLFTMDDILKLLTQYDNNNSNAEALTTFKTSFLKELSGSSNIEESPTLKQLTGETTNTEAKSMYSLSRLREFDFGPRSVNVALFKHPYTPEEIVEIMFRLKSYSGVIIKDVAKQYDALPKQNKFMKFLNNKELPPNYFESLENSLSQKREEINFKTEVTKILNEHPELVGLFDKAIRNFHYSQSSKSYVGNPETRNLLGDHMS